MDQEEIHVPNPGQRYINDWIIYSALGEPEIDKDRWGLELTGLVDKPRKYSYKEISSMPQLEYYSDFNCVTAWSIKKVKWSGPSLRKIIIDSEPKDDAGWVMFRCAEGYSTPVPIEYAMDEKSIIALKMNEQTLRVEQGFPARPFIPELYGWKSAKWLTQIELISDYEDGYWEQYGYHERGKVSESERYTSGLWRRVKKNAKKMMSF